MAPRLVSIGGGEHARVVMEAARLSPADWAIAGFTDPDDCVETVKRLGCARLGEDVAPDEAARSWFMLGIGNLAVRRRVVAELASRGLRWATIIHPRATVSDTASIEPGTVVLAGAIINSGARVGAHCIVNTGAIVEHDAVLGDFVHLAPGAVLGGGARVGEAAHIGLGARVRDHVNIGSRVQVGMGAVVVGDVADGATVLGNPAKPPRAE